MKTMHRNNECKKILTIALAIIMIAGIMTSPSHVIAASGLTVSTDKIGGNSANLVSVTLGGNRTADILVANKSIHTDQAASAMIDNAKAAGTIVAAVNGGFFNSYYNTGKALSYPDNCAQVYATLVKDNTVIHGGGKINAIGFDYDGRAFIDQVSIKPLVSVNESNPSTIWGVNKFSADPGGIFLLNDMFDYSIAIPNDSSAYIVKDGMITEEKSAGSHKIADGTQLLVYNSAAANNIMQWGSLPAVGDTVNFGYAAEARKPGTNQNWENMKTVTGGGRMLVIDSKNVASSSEYNSTLDSDPKQAAGNKSLRTFIAVMADGSLLMGNANASFINIADYLVKKGAKDAVCMDGGASTMLYADNKGMITNAGRKLATVIAVVDKQQQDQNPTEYADQPSIFFIEAIKNARELGILPDELDSAYKSNITRMEFCRLIVKLIESIDGTVSDRLEAIGIPDSRIEESTYPDTTSYDVKCCSALNLVSGYADGSFKPHNKITRQEAAVILRKLCKIYDISPNTIIEMSFKDNALIADWSRDDVSFVASLGIMNGDGTNFNPLKNITREQAVSTIMNFYEL